MAFYLILVGLMFVTLILPLICLGPWDSCSRSKCGDSLYVDFFCEVICRKHILEVIFSMGNVQLFF